MINRPYLPGLESVDHRKDPVLGPMLLVLNVVVFLAGPLVWILVALVGRKPIPVANCLGLAGVFAAGMLLLFALRTPYFDYGWRTDSESLTITGILRRRRILWRDFVAAETKWISLPLGRRFVLQSRQGKVLVPTDNPYLSTSVWQHMNRVNLASGLELDTEAASLWQSLSVSAADEMTWENWWPPTLVKFALAILADVTAFVLLAIYVHDKFLRLVLSGVVAVAFCSTCSSLIVARRVVVNRDGLEIDTVLRRIHVKWMM